MSDLAELLGYSSAQALGLSLLCGLLTLAAALVLALLRDRTRLRTYAWWGIIAFGLAGIVLTMERRVNHSNATQYYMGAKYDCAYFDFFKLFVAGRGQPQVVYRDLRNPNRMIRVDPRDQRLYLTGLFENQQVDYDPALTLDELLALATRKGLIEHEARNILRTRLHADEVADFEADARTGKMYTDDFGFNGSPLYVLLRKFDPTLYRPYGPSVVIFNTVLQLFMLGLVIWLAARVFAWTREEAFLVAALIMASIDFSGWGLNGLTVAGWLLPVFLALEGYRSGKNWLAGLGIAWATLIKLFPLALVMPLVLIALRGYVLDRDEEDGPPEAQSPQFRAIRVLLSTVLFGGILVGISSFTGTSWSEYLDRFVVQFQHSNYLANGVGLSKLLHAAGILKSDWLVVPQLVTLCALGWIMWMQPRKDFWRQLPMLSLVLLGVLGFVTETWFNYYAIIALFLVPGLLRVCPRWTIALLVMFGISYALPDYTYTYRSEGLPELVKKLGPALVVFTALPHLLLPLTALVVAWRKVRGETGGIAERAGISQLLHRLGPALVMGGFMVSLGLLAWEAYRNITARRIFVQAEQLARLGELEPAFEKFTECARLLPKNGAVHFNLGTLHEARGEAGKAEERYHLAVLHDPEMLPAYNNLGILYMQHGKADLAMVQFEKAKAVAPWDEELRFNLGNSLLGQGRTDEAIAEYKDALRIDPNLEQAKTMLVKIAERQAAETP